MDGDVVMQQAPAAMAAMELMSLPAEVLEKIVCDPSIEVRDILNLSQTCAPLEEIVSSNTIWKLKFEQRWPKLFRGVLTVLCKNNTDKTICWKSVFKHRIKVGQAVICRLREIARANYYEEDRYQLACDDTQVYTFPEAGNPSLAEDVGSHPALASMFGLNKLREMVAVPPESQFEDMTTRFYADQSLHCLSHSYLKQKIWSALTVSVQESDLEEGATLIAQWMQPHEDFSVADIKTKLDRMAGEVKDILRVNQPTHPMFAPEKDKRGKVSPDICCESLWPIAECKPVITTVGQCVTSWFNQNFERFQDPRKSYLNCVMAERQAIPITLCLVVMGLCRRLGVVVEPVSFFDTFLLRWLEHPLRSGLSRYTFLDPFHRAYDLTSSDVASRVQRRDGDDLDGPINRAMTTCSKQEMLQRMLRNLTAVWRQNRTHRQLQHTMLRHVVDLQCMMEPGHPQHTMLMVQLLLQLEVNLKRVISLIELVVATHPEVGSAFNEIPLKCEAVLANLRQKSLEPREDKVKRRADYPEVVFAVGLIMHHRRYHYRCVIVGWDRECLASDAWIRQMGVDRLPDGRHQPFYHVWAADDTERYAAQENLEVAPSPGPVRLPKVSRMFDSYNKLYYVPNEHLAADYPDDLQCCADTMDAFLKHQDDQSRAEWVKKSESSVL